MKRVLLAAVLGVATTTLVYGQGHIWISNYAAAPYNQVVWGVAGTGGAAPGSAVNDTSLQFQMFYGAGVVTDPAALTAGATFSLSPNSSLTGPSAYDPGAGHGPGGYFDLVEQVLPNWTAGDTYTFMYEVTTPGLSGQSALWQESSQIVALANPPKTSAEVPGLTVVPEPTSFALMGLGAGALLFFRRRR